jgi:hypothetical protein
MSGVIDSILELTEECYAEQKKAGSIQIPYKYWLGMMDKFIEGAPYNPRVSLWRREVTLPFFRPV